MLLLTLSLLLAGCSKGAGTQPPASYWLYENNVLVQKDELQFDPLPPPAEADLDGDELPEQVIVEGGQLQIRSGDASAWESPTSWNVSGAFLADLNQDGELEVAVLVWRPFRPWPIDEFIPKPGRIDQHQNEDGMSCHLILVGFRDGSYSELWAGSALADPLIDFSALDADGDGRQELAALEGSYTDSPGAPFGAPSRQLTLWEWNGFGFSLLARAPAVYRSLERGRTPEGLDILLLR